jgi:ABC-type multidrug transport system fused ATPase/permease subunit
MPSSPPRAGVRGARPSSSPSRVGHHNERSPLLPRPASETAQQSSSGLRYGSLRPVASRDNSLNPSELSASTAAASSLSVNNSSGGGPSFDGVGSSSGGSGRRAHSDESEGSDRNAGSAGGSVFGSSPTSLSGFFAIFAHSVALQSWTSYVLALSFHVFHVLLILAFLLSPILFRSTIFSSQTMAKELLESQGVIKHRGSNGSPNLNSVTGGGGGGKGNSNDNNTPLLLTSVSRAPVAIESVWAIHDALFFLEPGHVVVPTAIENSFGTLRHRKKDRRDGDKNNKDSNDGTSAGKTRDATGRNPSKDPSSGDGGGGEDGKRDDNDDTHTYVVPHGGNEADGNGAEKLISTAHPVSLLADDEADIGGEREARCDKARNTSVVPVTKHINASQLRPGSGEGPFFNFAAPPPVAPKLPMSQRKSATRGRATLSKIFDAWEASPLYSSPLALTLFYYLYNIGCVILLLTVTDGMLTGHFSVLRLFISLAELLWCVHHGAHAFVIFCWMCLLSHWPYHASFSESDKAFLRSGTPYAVVSKTKGEVAMYWFYRAAPTEGHSAGGYHSRGKILQDEINLKYYLYDQVWYLKPVASAVAATYLVMLSLCIARDLHRMLDAVVGVRVLMEPEGCVRCPLCGELMEICQQHRYGHGKSIYRSAHSGAASSSWRRTMWWWRWIRSAVRGSSSGHRVPTPRLHSPLWRWLLPMWCGGGPQSVEAASFTVANDSTSLETLAGGNAPYTIEDMLEDIEFYEQSAVRRSAAAPQDTMTEETAHLMRWLTVVPNSNTSIAVPMKREHSGGSASEGDEVADALGIGSSGSSSSEDEVERGLVKAMPAGAGPSRRPSEKPSSAAAAAASTAVMRSSTSSHCLQSPMLHGRGSGRLRRRHHSHSRSPGSTSSSQQAATKPHRMTRFTGEVLYWNYATRHVHHRCPKLYLDAQEATDDEEDGTDDSNSAGSTSEASSSAESCVTADTPRAVRGAVAAAGAQSKGKRVTGSFASSSLAAAAATSTSTRAHIGDAPTAASRANFSDRGMRRSLSPRATANRDEAGATGNSAATAAAAEEKLRQLRRDIRQQPALQRTIPAPTTEVGRSCASRYGAGASGKVGDNNNKGNSNSGIRNYGTIGPNFSEAPSQLYARGSQPVAAAANHIVRRGVYDPTKDEEDEFRPGNAFQSFDRAGWLSRLTYSWLNPLLTFGLLEPTLLRQERFLPALPEQLLSLDNIAVPAWRLWVHRKTWYATFVAKPGELLIPSNEAMERAEEQVLSLADLHEADVSDDGDESESSEDKQTVVMLGHTSLKQAAKFRPQRPRRSWEERVFWAVTAPARYLFVHLFYYIYIGTSRTVWRTRRRLVRELLKDRLVAAAEDMYDANGYKAMEANEALEEATWALAEMASSCGSSAAAPSAGSALPTHMRRQLALSDVCLYYLFLEHSCGRRFILVAAPLLLLSELLLLLVVPVLVTFVQYLQRVDTIEILPGRRESPGDQESVTAALLLAALMGVLLLLQGVAESAYVSQVQQAAMEARTCVRAMVLEKTLALPLAQRTFTEGEVVTLATEEATRVAKCIVSLHHTWSCPLRIALLALLLGYYLGWAAATVVCVGPFVIVPSLRHASHESRQSRHAAEEATKPRLSLLQQALGHIREVKGMLLECWLMRCLRRARGVEAAYAEEVAMAEGTAGMLAGGFTALLMVVALVAESAFAERVLHDVDVLIPTLVIFVLLTTPLLELPTLFTVVARGFLSMKRIEAYLRQTPDEFVGTWVDLPTFSAMQQQLRVDNPTSALLHYRRGSVVCRDSSFTWQHDLTEEPPMTLLRDVDVCIEPGQLVVVQGSMGSGKTTLLLSILGEVNRCVTAKGSDDGQCSNSSATDFESESSFSVVSATEAAAVAARASVPPSGTENDSSMHSRTGSCTLSNTTTNTMPFPSNKGGGGNVGGATAAAAATSASPDMFTASPTESRDGRRQRDTRKATTTTAAAAAARAGGSTSAEAALSRIATAAATTAAAQRSRDDSKKRTASNASRNAGRKSPSNDHDGTNSTAATTDASQLPPPGLEDGESSTGGFLVFGSCAYCAEVPWLQNDTIRANIMSSGGPVQLERWYYTVLRACALNADVAALPQGDATVVGDRGESLSLSMRCRIAIARAVYSKSHVYLFDSVLSPLEPSIQEHIIREVFHKLLRKRTVILASNVGLRSLRPHRVFSLVEGGVVREDTELYKAVSSLNARSDEDEESGKDANSDRYSEVHGNGAASGSSRSCSSRSSSGNTSQGTTAPLLPTLYAEEFEEAHEESEMDRMEAFDNDPMAAATALLFDGNADFGSHDPLFSKLGDRHDGAGNEGGGGSVSNSFFFSSGSGANSSALRPRRTVHFSPRSPIRRGSQLHGLGASGRLSPGTVTLPPPMIPIADTASAAGGPAESPATTTMAASSRQSSTFGLFTSTPLQGASTTDVDATRDAGSEEVTTTTATSAASEASSCSTGQYIRNHYAQQLEREKMLRHRHRLSFFIFLRFMGGQAMWLLFTTFLQQLVSIGIDILVAIWPAVAKPSKRSASRASRGQAMTAFAKLRQDLSTWTSLTDAAFLAAVSALTALVMVLTLLRTRAVYVGVYGTMHFIHNQIVSRVLHAPASYFDSRIIALLNRVLDSDAAVAEYRVPETAEVLLSCTVQLFFIAMWSTFVNPIFFLLLPVTVSLFYHISQRHAVVLREVRKLEVGSVSGMADILREVYQGASTVRCMALQDRLREEYCRALDTVNTASMVAYLADRWVELRLHVLTVLAVCSAAMLGVIFTFSYSRPSLTAVAIIVALRAGPVLSTLCKGLGQFSVTEWISVQRLMSLWSVPQEPLALEGEADLYSYRHVRRDSSGFYVELEDGQDAPLLDFVGTPISSPNALAAVSQQEHHQSMNSKKNKKERDGRRAGEVRGEAGGTHASASPVAPQSPLSAFAAASNSSSSASTSADALVPGAGAKRAATGEASTITLPQLELRNVSARYRTTLPYVLRHVNLAVYPRERLGVVGHAGQGKGSLFNVLMRLVDVIEGGGVYIDGENAACVPYPVLRGWFGLIPQEPLLVHGSWRSNLLMGYHPEHRLFIESANGNGNRPYLPIEMIARQQLRQQQQKDGPGATNTCTATTAALARLLAAEQQGDSATPLIEAVTDRRESSGHRAHADGNDNCTPMTTTGNTRDSVASLPMSESYGSTDSARAFMGGEGQGRLRYMDSVEEDRLSRNVSRGGANRRCDGGGAKAFLASVARRLRGTLLPSRRHSSRGNVSRRRERTPSGDASISRGSSSGGGGVGGRRQRRRQGSRQPSSRAVSGHAAEGAQQPEEDAVLWAALRAVGLDAAVEFDGGLDAPLSGGDVSETDLTESQCRLLCLARAVLNKPPIVLLEDAVFSGAEAQTDRAIRRVLANELRDSTVIIIAHRMSTVLNLCTRVVAVRDGMLLPIADLRSATSLTAPSPLPQNEGAAMNASSTGSLGDLVTPPLTSTIHPDVLRQLSYYVE